ncbi:MAG: DUF1836 domain-containing protein [Erysipelotrichaceae bacterium]|nr:DUF1836 domain-containing protein [Erysipelotrichaceae bacterium]MBQ6494116.1 DUF1836 domain-containing protein [Erysipelotrichaceae bacterium]
MLSKTIPGTNIEYGGNEDAFSVLKPMIEITGGLSLGQICRITGLQASTIQNWVKRKFVPRPERKKYFERHLSRVLLISALRDCMNIEDIGELMHLINGDTDDESDDIVSEEDLYDYFCKAVSRLDEQCLSETSIEATISSLLDKVEEINYDRLLKALKVMVYAYISGRCLEQIAINLDSLRGGRK